MGARSRNQRAAPDAERFTREAIRLSRHAVDGGHGGPFGAVVVRDGKIVGRGFNKVISSNDPTAHAEVVAIRAACRRLHSFSLAGCELYASCEPCPMCLAAIYWARIKKVYFAGTREDAAGAGFDDARFYDELARAAKNRSLILRPMMRKEALPVFEAWNKKNDKVPY